MDLRLGRIDHYAPVIDMAHYQMERQCRCAVHLNCSKRCTKRRAYKGHSSYKCRIGRNLLLTQGYSTYLKTLPVGQLLIFDRLVGKKTYHLYSKSGDFFTTTKARVSRPVRMHLTLNLGHRSALSQNRMVYHRKRKSSGLNSTMVTTLSTFLCQPFPNYGRNTLLHHSLFFKSSVWGFGSWMTIGTTPYSRYSCWLASKALWFGKGKGPLMSFVG